MLSKLFLILGTLFLLSNEAAAQSKTFYDSSGRAAGRSSTDSQGSTTYYDSSGKSVGRSSTDSQGTTTFYDSSGRVTGRERPSVSGSNLGGTR